MAAMLPNTVNGLNPLVCISAMQKCIRRGMEREAMEFACELVHTSKALCSMVCNRLELVSHEDIDTQLQPQIVPFVHTACQQARDWHSLPNPGKSRMAIGNAIRLMCRAAKSREGDHFQAAVGLQSLLNKFVPKVPDWAHDMHTHQGIKKGRGLEHFREEGALLVPPPPTGDAYEDECYEMWHIRDAAKEAGQLF